MANLKISIGGTIYQINEKAFRNTGWNKEPITPYFYVSYAAAGQLVKQWASWHWWRRDTQQRLGQTSMRPV